MIDLINQLIEDRRRRLNSGAALSLEEIVLRRSWASDPLHPAQRLAKHGTLGAILGAAASLPLIGWLDLVRLWDGDASGMVSLAVALSGIFAGWTVARGLARRSIMRRELEEFESWLQRSDRHAWVEYARMLQQRLKQMAGNRAYGTEQDALDVERQLTRIQRLIDSGPAESAGGNATSLGLLAAEAQAHIDQYLMGSDSQTVDLDRRLPEEAKRRLLDRGEARLSQPRAWD